MDVACVARWKSEIDWYRIDGSLRLAACDQKSLALAIRTSKWIQLVKVEFLKEREFLKKRLRKRRKIQKFLQLLVLANFPYVISTDLVVLGPRPHLLSSPSPLLSLTETSTIAKQKRERRSFPPPQSLSSSLLPRTNFLPSSQPLRCSVKPSFFSFSDLFQEI